MIMANDSPPPLAITGLIGCNGIAARIKNAIKEALMLIRIGSVNSPVCNSLHTR
jgi:hypothetical protein